MATAATKVGPKFQVTIPKNVRDAVGLKVGDLVEASVGREGIVALLPCSHTRIAGAAGASTYETRAARTRVHRRGEGLKLPLTAPSRQQYCTAKTGSTA